MYFSITVIRKKSTSRFILLVAVLCNSLSIIKNLNLIEYLLLGVYEYIFFLTRLKKPNLIYLYILFIIKLPKVVALYYKHLSYFREYITVCIFRMVIVFLSYLAFEDMFSFC